MVMQVETASPSAKAGIMLGDLIISIQSQLVTGVEDVQRIRGAWICARRPAGIRERQIRGPAAAIKTSIEGTDADSFCSGFAAQSGIGGDR